MINIAKILLVGVLLIFPISVGAQGGIDLYNQHLSNAGTEVYGNPVAEDLGTAIGRIIGVALSFLGVILLLIILYAGFLWMTAGGNSEQVTKAKSMMSNAVIGLVISLLAYAISNFIVRELTKPTNPTVSVERGVVPAKHFYS